MALAIVACSAGGGVPGVALTRKIYGPTGVVAAAAASSAPERSHWNFV